MQILGHIRNQKDALAISRDIQFEQTVHSSYAPQRIEQWFRAGSNLQSIKAGHHKILAYTDPHPRLVALGSRFLPKWHSLLSCAGIMPDNCSNIDWHRDHGAFTNWAVMLNLGQAYFYEEDRIGSLQFEIEDYDLRTGQKIKRIIRASQYLLDNGIVVRINIKLLHRAEQLSTERYNHTFRHFKPEWAAKL